MKGKDLLEAMEYLEDALIESAHEDKTVRKHRKRRIFISLAACLACVLVLWSVSILLAVQKAREGGKEALQNVSENNVWEEILIPSSNEIDLSEDVRVVSKEDLLSLSLKWKNEEDFDFFYDFMDSCKIQVSGRALSLGSYYYIGNEEMDAFVMADDSAAGALSRVPALYSEWTSSAFTMKQYDSTELEKYFTQIEKQKEKVQEQIKYLAGHLNEEDYGGSYYDAESGNFIVWLVNESYRKELEQQEIVCEAAAYSMQQLYEKMHELWEKREELGIMNISINSHNNRLSVFGTFKEKEFAEKLNNTENEMIVYNELTGNTTECEASLGMSGGRGIEDADEFISFLQALYTQNHPAEAIDFAAAQYFDDLKTALIKLKENYPEYTYLQLYYHVSTDCEYEYCLNFDRSLESFVNSLPAYKKDMDFLREQQYGDPQRLGLKSVLYYYKQLYPQKSYQDIYDTYLVPQNIEETDISSKAEKLYQYLYIKAIQKEKLKEKAAARSEELCCLLYILLSCIILFLILLLRAFFRKKQMKKTEFHQYLIRETAALLANFILFIILPHLLYLMADPSDMMAVVFLPDCYLGPLFGLFGSAIYSCKKGNWWNFLLYTTVCLLLQPFIAFQETESLYIIYLVYILPAEIIGTIFIKLKGKIKIIH